MGAILTRTAAELELEVIDRAIAWSHGECSDNQLHVAVEELETARKAETQ